MPVILPANQQRSLWLRYGLVVPAVALSILVELALEPFVGVPLPFLLIWPTVMVAAVYGGLGPGLFATALSLVTTFFCMVEPRFTWGLTHPADLIWLLVFLFLGVALSILSEYLRQARHAVERQVRQTMQKQIELEHEIEERKQAKAALQTSHDRFRLLSEVADYLLFGNEPQQAVEAVYERVTASLDLDVYFHYRVNDDRRSLTLTAYHGVADALAQRYAHVEFGQAVCGRVAQQRSKMVVADPLAPDDPRADFLRDLGLSAWACFPLLVEDRLIGTLAFGTRRRACLTADELDVLDTVANQVAMAVERSGLIAQLRQQAKELAEADRHKNDFLATVVHELRGPLAPIQNAVCLLKRVGAPAQAAPAVGILERQARQMQRLVDDLMELSRVGRGKVRLQKEVIELAPIVAQAVEACRPLNDAHQHTLTVSVPEEPVWLEADPGRLTQIVSNLLTNAVKYTPDGGHIELRVERQGREVILRVRDNGLGISAEMLPKVFDPFAQGSHAEDRSDGGIGVGLALVRTLVQLHGGRVQACSAGHGQGSEFVVHLPAVEKAARPAKAAAAS